MNSKHIVSLLRVSSLLALVALLAGSLVGLNSVSAQDQSQLFPETGKTVKGMFLAYWQAHGALSQQGYPISDEMQEKSDLDGKTYTVQYFERAVFESHPENAGTPYEVLLSQLGKFQYRQKYGDAGAPNQTVSTTNPQVFPATGFTVGGKFRDYWEANGGLAQQGYPISNEFQEKSDLDGKTYTVQYFERAVFELHPENAGTPYEVLLSQLGKFQYRQKYTMPTATPTMPTMPTSTAILPSPTIAQPTATPVSSGDTSPDCSGIPENQGMEVRPPCGPLFSKFYLIGTGFDQDLEVGVWATMPNGQLFGAPFHIPVPRDGRTKEVYLHVDNETPFYGLWVMTMEGLQTHRRVYGYFKLYPAATPTPKK